VVEIDLLLFASSSKAKLHFSFLESKPLFIYAVDLFWSTECIPFAFLN